MRRLLPTTLLCAFALLALPAAASACPGENAVPGTIGPKRHAAAIRCLVNLERQNRGIHKLRASGRLNRAARRHARAMAVRDFFSHVSPGGSTLRSRLRAVRYRFGSAGENLAWGAGGRGTPRSLVNSWLSSPSHRRIMLSGAYRHIGVGVSLGAPVGRVAQSATVDATFARRR